MKPAILFHQPSIEQFQRITQFDSHRCASITPGGKSIPTIDRKLSFLWIIGALVTACSYKGLKGPDGFYFTQYQIYLADDAGFPIYVEPSPDSAVLRKTHQFETYVLGDTQNGFARIKMGQDDLTG